MSLRGEAQSFISTRIGRAIAVASLLGLLAGSPVGRAEEQAPAVQGQAVVLLPDGRELRLGGVLGGRILRDVYTWDPSTGEVSILGALEHARAWHTATLLPEGRVLVLGGLGADGLAAELPERYDAAAGHSEALPPLDWSARVGHSATLVSDRHVVLAGGLFDGVAVASVEVLELSTWSVSFLANLPRPRALHAAHLLADGRVSIAGGDDGVSLDESVVLVDPSRGGIEEADAPEERGTAVAVAASSPADGDRAASIAQSIWLRLTGPARPETVTPLTIRLAGPGGDVSTAVVPTEHAQLIFVTPESPLEPGVTYALSLTGVSDVEGADVRPVRITFSTAGAPADGGASEAAETVWRPVGADRDHWRVGEAGGADRHSQALPPLRATDGRTALSGRVLRLNGAPLANVTLELGGVSTRTDATGRFLLVNDSLPRGIHELWIDGRSANRGQALYGTFEAAVDISAGKTAVLPYTIWMPAIDHQNAVTIPAPTTAETIVTTPAISGLELRLPPGATIRDRDGQVVREMSITPIPLDRTPFPLPAGVEVPIYFTVQPGGAYVEVAGGGGYSRGARLVYPNYNGLEPGSRLDFWHYDPSDRHGWYIYGTGAVAPDGRQVVPDRGIYLYEFTGAMVGAPALGGPEGKQPDDDKTDGDPVQLGTGLFVMSRTDLQLTDVLPIGIHRTYRATDQVSRSFGIGATHVYDMFLVGDKQPWTYAELVMPDGSRVHFDRISAGTSYNDAVYEHVSSPTVFYKSKLAWNGSGWNLDLRDGSRVTFRDGFTATRPAEAAATSFRDRFGNTIALTRNAAADLTTISSPNGRSITLTYDGGHRIIEARDDINRTVAYAYDSEGRLSTVTDIKGGVTEYTYDTAHRLLSIKDPRNIVYLTNEYDTGGRVVRQTQADNSTFEFAYTLDGAGLISSVDVTDPRGHVRRVVYDQSRHAASDTNALGTATEQTTTYTRQSGGNFLTSSTDPLGRTTAFTYDTSGNLTTVTLLAGTGGSLTTTYAYDPTFSDVTSVTDPLSRQTLLEYATSGALTKIRDPLNRDTLFGSNAAGQTTSITDPLGNRTDFGYEGGDLSSMTDPLGRTTSLFRDSIGRVRSITNPAGHATQYDYDAGDQITRVTDPLGGTTDFSYDPNGNLLSVTDARSNTTSYSYDVMDRGSSRTDPLSRSESYGYDANGNLVSMTDRKGQVTSYLYDALDRLVMATYPDRFRSYTYDAGDRLTQITDSVSGSITRGFDDLGRMTSEVTPDGSIGYDYDAAGRLLSMTVGGQPAVTYGYDNGDRLLSISRGAVGVTLGHDAADRRTSVTLPNGVVMEYDYDAASQLTGITYRLGAVTLGDLTYGYDAAGNPIEVGGSWARVGLPAPMSSSTYDAANQLVQRDQDAFSYDANGNLTADGTRTYTWNSRNELAAIAGVVDASFVYDAVGRRSVSSVGLTATSILYNGANPVRETTGASVTHLLSGLGLDEFFGRIEASSVWSYLTDALGSIVGISDGAGALQTEYDYQPFGGMTTSGAPTTNRFGFTGREADGTGLYYYRARYYDPRLQRFISEDPIGFGGGDVNLHAYVVNSPQRWTDPSGTCIPFGPVAVSCLPAAAEAAGVLAAYGAVAIWERLYPRPTRFDPLNPGEFPDYLNPPADWARLPSPDGRSRWRDKDGDTWHWDDRGGPHGPPHWDMGPGRNSPWYKPGKEGGWWWPKGGRPGPKPPGGGGRWSGGGWFGGGWFGDWWSGSWFPGRSSH